MRKRLHVSNSRDIAHTAGYTKGAVYKHFTAKEDPFLAVNDDVAQRWDQLSCRDANEVVH